MQGGISGKGNDVMVAGETLARQERPSAGCMRFDPGGDRLFAVDPKGKLVVVEFERG